MYIFLPQFDNFGDWSSAPQMVDFTASSVDFVSLTTLLWLEPDGGKQSKMKKKSQKSKDFSLIWTLWILKPLLIEIKSVPYHFTTETKTYM